MTENTESQFELFQNTYDGKYETLRDEIDDLKKLVHNNKSLNEDVRRLTRKLKKLEERIYQDDDDSIMQPLSYKSDNMKPRYGSRRGSPQYSSTSLSQKVIRGTYGISFGISIVLTLGSLLSFYPEMTNWKNESGHSVPTFKRDGFILGPVLTSPVIWFFIGISHHYSMATWDPVNKFPVPIIYAFCYLLCLSMYVAFNYLLESTGANPWYFLGYDFYLQFVFIFAASATGAKFRMYFWKKKNKKAIDLAQDKINKSRKKSSLNKALDEMEQLDHHKDNAKLQTGDFERLMILAVALVIFVLYPIIIIPIFNSDSISDVFRMILTTVVHMFISEALVTWTRLKSYKWRTSSDELKFTMNKIVIAQIWAFAVEMYLSILRRMMIGSIRDETILFMTLAFTSIEEGVLRSTFMQREKFWQRKLGHDDLNHIERTVHKSMCAVSIANAMICEIVVFMYCKNRHDPCSCTDGPYRLYHDICYFNGSKTLSTFPRKYMLGITENATVFNSSYANNQTFTGFLVDLNTMQQDQAVSPLTLIEYNHPLMIAFYSICALLIAMPFSA
eukprot:g847.t1